MTWPECSASGQAERCAGVAPANAYPTRDGSEVLIAGNADAMFARLCAAMGQPELARTERWATHRARGEHEHELDGIIADWTKRSTATNCSTVARAQRPGRTRLHRSRHADRRALPRSGDGATVTSRARYRHRHAGRGPEVQPHAGIISDVGPTLGEHTDRIAEGTDA